MELMETKRGARLASKPRLAEGNTPATRTSPKQASRTEPTTNRRNGTRKRQETHRGASSDAKLVGYNSESHE